MLIPNRLVFSGVFIEYYNNFFNQIMMIIVYEAWLGVVHKLCEIFSSLLILRFYFLVYLQVKSHW